MEIGDSGGGERRQGSSGEWRLGGWLSSELVTLFPPRWPNSSSSSLSMSAQARRSSSSGSSSEEGTWRSVPAPWRCPPGTPGRGSLPRASSSGRTGRLPAQSRSLRRSGRAEKIGSCECLKWKPGGCFLQLIWEKEVELLHRSDPGGVKKESSGRHQSGFPLLASHVLQEGLVILKIISAIVGIDILGVAFCECIKHL